MLKLERIRPVSLSLDEELDKLLTRRALKENTSRSDLARRLLRQALATEKRQSEKES